MSKAPLAAIVRYCDGLLQTAEVQDYEGAANGLQVENHGTVTRIAATVDASLATVRLAVQEGHFHGEVDCEQFAFEFQGIMLGFNHLRRLLRDPKAERRTRAAFERLIRTAEAP